MISDAIKNKRTIRLFENKEIDFSILKDCVDAARLSSSARNSQPLEYIIVDDSKVLAQLVPLIKFGGEISEDKLAVKGKEPKAVIVIVAKKGAEEYAAYDIGIAAQNIALVAYENGLGCCMQGAIEREKIASLLEVSSDFYVDLVISIGYPVEKPVVEECEDDPDYFRDGELTVQKRKLEKVLHRNKF